MTKYINADALRDFWLYGGSNDNIYNTNDFLYELDGFPAADVAPVVHAKWEGYSGEGRGRRRCSNCKHPAISYKEHWKVTEVLSGFCPNCGAKMTRKENEG